MEKTVCELFAGVGGFRLGLEKASKDWHTVWFSQWEPGAKKQWAHDCYVQHWGDVDENTGKDIALVDKTQIPNHNLLVGGFPCQDYSVARPLPGATGIEGKKGVLWWQIVETVEAKHPPFILLENVDRLLKSPASQRGRDFGVMLSCLNNLGYSVEWRVINAAEYGAAQRRRRVFIFAYKNTTKYSEETSILEGDEIISSKGFFARTFPIEPLGKISMVKLETENVWEISESFKFEFENAGFMRNGLVTTSKVIPVFEEPIPLSRFVDTNVPEEFYLRENLEKWKFLKGAKKLLRTSKTGHQYNYAEGAIAFPDPLESQARTMLTSEASVNRSTHVIEDPQTKQLRLITPREAERIQGFEDDWTNTGMTKRMRYFCMGNALVVPMITRMAKTLDEIFLKE
ncbi:MAG: DNA (cytosine-5-)-methyltransferase [Bacteroidaceae bacterium]|nr:DNA (cytosine-5-)-methyltransferase [Bacteroidaceae bacterium]